MVTPIEQKKASIPSRFALVDVPDPKTLEAEFVYNFFTPDERFNRYGVNNADKLAKDLKNSPLDFNVPRYIRLSWNVPQDLIGQYAADPDQSPYAFTGNAEQVFDEEDFTTIGFGTYNLADPDSLNRVRQKYTALSNILGLNRSETDQSQTIASDLGLSDGDNNSVEFSNKAKYIDPLVAPTPEEFLVNFIPDTKVKTVYDSAAENRLLCQVSAGGFGTYLLRGIDDVSPLSNVTENRKFEQLGQWFENNIPKQPILVGPEQYKGPSPVDVMNDLLFNDATLVGAPETQPGLVNVQHIGYLIEKSELTPSGGKLTQDFQGSASATNVQRILIKNPDVTEFIDSKITYGTRYSYVLRNIYRVKAVVIAEGDDENDVTEAVSIETAVASKPSVRRNIKTVENQAPKPPDGVFYRFNYDKGRGLVLTWQIPAGRSRDVKYFQVFRRYSIDEPFQCIAEIDFNDTDRFTNPPPPKAERVRSDLIFQTNYAQTYFMDQEFDRNSRPTIYAVCAVDAHGLTSGYSTQSLVSFNKPKNRIEIKNISRPGAPKQYPNFFVDPRMDDNITVDSFSQVAVYDSQSESINLYFDPDCKTMEVDGKIVRTFLEKNAGNYKIHFINLDLQKSATCQIDISEPTAT